MHTEQANIERPRGRGSIYKRGVFWHVCFSKGGRIFRLSTGSLDRTEAERFLDRKLAEVFPVPNPVINTPALEESLLAVIGDKRKDQIVYVVRPKGYEFVKIGFTTCTNGLQNRIKSLECSWPMDAELMAVFRGSRELEKRLHRALYLFRAKREWFYLNDTITAFVRRSRPIQLPREKWPAIERWLPPELPEFTRPGSPAQEEPNA